MKPNEAKLLYLLSNNDVTFFIPPYQRNYEWTDDQCKVFLEDILKTYKANSLGGRTEHFFGSVTYFQTETAFGQPNKLVLIDGQQRITTTMLFLIALRDILDDDNLKGYIDSKYLKNENVKGDSEYKIKLKQVETDWAAYRDLVLGNPVTDKEKSSAVYKNYRYFVNKLSELQEMGVSSLQTLKSMNSMTDEELDAYVKLYDKKLGIANRRAVEENADLLNQTNEKIKALQTSAEKQLNSLSKAYENNLKKLGVTAKIHSKDVGLQITAGIKSGLAAGEKGLSKSLKNLVESMVKQTKKSLKIKSPSGVYEEEVGRFIPPGIGRGIERAMPAMERETAREMQGMAERMKNVVNEEMAAKVGTVRMKSGYGGGPEFDDGPGGGNVYQTININQPVKTPSETARAIRLEQQYGLAGDGD